MKNRKKNRFLFIILHRIKKKNDMKPMKLSLIAAFASLMLMGCATERIGNINSQPYRYHESAVQIKGRVTNTTNLFVLKTFRVADKTGDITVVASEDRAALPAVGQKIKVRGKVYQAFKLGSLQKIVVVEGIAPIVK